MRLIDADALPKYTGYALSADEVAMAVENAPTVEAEPIRHGRWIDGGLYTICSICGDEFYLGDLTIDSLNASSHYCPNCGARMDGGKE